MVSPNLTELVSSTLRDRDKQYADNVSNHIALLRSLKTRGNNILVDGGTTISKAIGFNENENFIYYSGYNVLDISPNDMLTAAEYQWKQAAAVVSMSGLEERINSGGNRVINLLSSRVDFTMKTISNQLAEGIYSDGTGTGGLQVGGLQLLVATDPTVGVVGGIDRAVFPFWRNAKFDTVVEGSGVASSTNIQGYMNTLFNSIVRGVDKPDLIVADNNFFGFYQNSLQTQQRFATSVSADLLGFTALKFNNADVLLENGSGIRANTMYMLDTSYIFFESHPKANMTALDSRNSVNQDAMVIPIIWQGNMTMNNARQQGILFDA